MTEPNAEYMRRNVLVCDAIGAAAILQAEIIRIAGLVKPPAVATSRALTGALNRIDRVSADLARWRDVAPDAPDYVRKETA
jgi:hypothetical protein